MVGTSGIDQTRNLRMPGEGNRHRRRGVGLSAHAHGERLEALEQHRCIERRHRGASLPDELVNVLLDEILGGENNTAETTALAVDVLSRRIDDAVRSQIRPSLWMGYKDTKIKNPCVSINYRNNFSFVLRNAIGH